MDLNTVDHLLMTTRTVRRRLDLTRPVEPDVLARCIEIAIQAPTGSNRQNWHFVVVTDPDKRARIAAYYAQSFEQYIGPRRETGEINAVARSAIYLADHLGEVPVHIIPCYDGRVEDAPAMAQAAHYGSILPAAWSLMLALRARGLGSAWTTLHLRYEREIGDLLGIPADVTQVALLPVAYFTGDDFKPAARRPAAEITYWDGWGQTR
jgi:nitroreductase